MLTTNNIRIKTLRPLISPSLLIDEIPISERAAQTVGQTRKTIIQSLHDQSDKLVIIVGPCSIHDPKAALEYAQRLVKLKNLYQETLCIVMRVYFEKPRTTVGWKGLINDPCLDNSFDINQGLRIARRLLLDINELGLGTACEFLDTFIPQYTADLTAWGAIGARTTESQIHRELTSGLSMPVGFKNGTTGNMQIAVDAIMAAKHSHHFLGVTQEGLAAIVATQGNRDCHIILRGSNTGSNYDPASIEQALALLRKQSCPARVMVDCSHGNSNKDHENQIQVVNELSQRIAKGEQHIFGLMIESNLVAGKQSLTPGKALNYGQSITDACIGWEQTEIVLAQLHETMMLKGCQPTESIL